MVGEDMAMNICFANDAFYRLIDYRDKQDYDRANNNSAISAIHRPDLMRLLSAVGALKGGECTFSSDFRLKTRLGKDKWVHAEGSLVEHEKLRKIVFVLYDLKKVEKVERNIEQNLQATRRLATTLSGGIASVRFDRDLSVLDADSNFIHLLMGIKEENAVSLMHECAEEDGNKLYSAFAAAYNQGTEVDLRLHPNVSRDKIIRLHGIRSGESEGYPVFSCVVYDVTNQENMKRKVHSAMEREQKILNRLPCHIIRHQLDGEGVLQSVSTELLEQLGFESEDMPGSISNLFLPEDCSRIFKAVEAFSGKEESFIMEYTLTGPGEKKMPVRAQICLLNDDEGNFICQHALVDLSREIELKNHQNAQEQQQRALMQLMDQPTFRLKVDESVALLDFNLAFENFTGYSKERLAEISGKELFTKGSLALLLSCCTQALADKESFEMGCTINGHNDEPIEAMLKGSIILSSNEKPILVAVIANAK